jgi:hypothetical protein
MMGATHGLNTLFSTSFLPFVLVRNLGFQMTNALNPVKVSQHCGVGKLDCFTVVFLRRLLLFLQKQIVEYAMK